MIPTRIAAVLGMSAGLAALAACSNNPASTSTGGSTPPAAAVQAVASVPGSVNGAVGSSQTVLVTFTNGGTDNVTGLQLLTALDSLPGGWSGPGSFSCASVAPGSACVLPLTYTPVSGQSGTLTLNYQYSQVDTTGQTSTPSASIAIAYAPTQYDNVLAAVSPGGQVIATQGGNPQSVAVTFFTDNGDLATNLSLSSALSALPSGWSASGMSFSCAQLSTGNGCQLLLTYTPTAGSSGVLTLNYTYANQSGATQNGSVQIPYATLSADAVVASYSPGGQIASVVGGAGQTVTVTFNSDDANAGQVSLSADALASLPAGWSTTDSSGLTCSNVAASGSSCQLTLTYAPATSGSGLLQLSYGYGNGGVGIVTIPYAGTPNDNVAATVSPAGTIGVQAGSSEAVTVVFTTDDGNTASNLEVTTGLSSLPSGWSSSSGSSFACSAVTGSTQSGADCQLTLTYAPLGAATGTLTLGYTYVNNAGLSQSGSVNISYAATAPYAYVTDPPYVYLCSLTGSGGLTGCTATGSGFTNPISLTFIGSYAYVADSGNGNGGSIIQCSVDTDGTLSSCSAELTGDFNGDPGYLYPSGNLLYIPEVNLFDGPEVCTIGTGGALSSSDCTVTDAVGGSNQASGVALVGSYAYVSTVGDNSLPGIELCTPGSGGALSGCTGSGTDALSAPNVIASDGIVYAVYGAAILACTPNSSGQLSSCVSSTPMTAPSGYGLILRGGITIQNGNLYIPYLFDSMSGNVSGVEVCAVGTGGALSNCADSGASFQNATDIEFNP